MKHYKNCTRTVSLVVLLLLSVATARARDEGRYLELPNFHQVNAQLYRGAQPKAGGLAQLARLGIKTIINLRADDDREDAEEREARALGLGYYNVPLPGLSRPKDAAVERALALINDARLQPVFVHCKRGADRTGTIIACYRIRHDGWTAEAATSEAKRYGLSWFERGMKDYIKDFARRAPTVLPPKTISRLFFSRRPALLPG
ncbi:MAG TPA: sulfur transferase domain-containing protein [Pyrinomonadaceae bacterium]|jgi:protein tyrosine/serine phosphatase